MTTQGSISEHSSSESMLTTQVENIAVVATPSHMDSKTQVPNNMSGSVVEAQTVSQNNSSLQTSDQVATAITHDAELLLKNIQHSSEQSHANKSQQDLQQGLDLTTLEDQNIDEHQEVGLQISKQLEQAMQSGEDLSALSYEICTYLNSLHQKAVHYHQQGKRAEEINNLNQEQLSKTIKDLSCEQINNHHIVTQVDEATAIRINTLAQAELEDVDTGAQDESMSSSREQILTVPDKSYEEIASEATLQEDAAPGRARDNTIFDDQPVLNIQSSAQQVQNKQLVSKKDALATSDIIVKQLSENSGSEVEEKSTEIVEAVSPNKAEIVACADTQQVQSTTFAVHSRARTKFEDSESKDLGLNIPHHEQAIDTLDIAQNSSIMQQQQTINAELVKNNAEPQVLALESNPNNPEITIQSQPQWHDDESQALDLDDDEEFDTNVVTHSHTVLDNDDEDSDEYESQGDVNAEILDSAFADQNENLEFKSVEVTQPQVVKPVNTQHQVQDPFDYIDKVANADEWTALIFKAGYSNGPEYSALIYSCCYQDPQDADHWAIVISPAFSLIINDPKFKANLTEKLSMAVGRKLRLSIQAHQAIQGHKDYPLNCPYDLAQKYLDRAIESSKQQYLSHSAVQSFIQSQGLDIQGLKVSLLN